MTSSMTILTSLAIKVALNSSVVSMYARFITIRNTTSVHDHHTLQRPFNWNTYIDRTGGLLLLLPKNSMCQNHISIQISCMIDCLLENVEKLVDCEKEKFKPHHRYTQVVSNKRAAKTFNLENNEHVVLPKVCSIRKVNVNFIVYCHFL